MTEAPDAFADANVTDAAPSSVPESSDAGGSAQRPAVTRSPGQPTRSGRRPWYRPWPLLVVAAAAVALAVSLYLVLGGSTGPTDIVVSASTGTVSQSVTSSGTLQPVTTADANFQVGGTVNNVTVSQGADVTAGQVLATVGTTDLELSLEEAQANLSGAEATLSGDESSGASSSTTTSDEAQVVSARNALAQAKDDLADATLTAPISGTVTTLDIAVGDTVAGSSGNGQGSDSGSGSGGSSGGSSSTEVVIEDLTHFEVAASVSAGSESGIKVGQQVVITPSSAGSPTVDGTVSSVSSLPTVSSGVASFPVLITVTGSPPGLYAGTSASVSIITEQRDGVLVVPSRAVLPEGGTDYVERVVEGKQVLTRVTTGLIGGSQTQITSGLQSGDQVAVNVFSTSTAGSGPGNLGPNTFIPGGPHGGPRQLQIKGPGVP